MMSIFSKKNLFLSFYLGCMVIKAIAQQHITTYHDHKDDLIKDKEMAAYSRIIKINPSNPAQYILAEHYANGNMRRVGITTTAEGKPKFEGNMITYYENGNKKSDENYQQDQLEGEASYYYENGQLKKEVIFLSKVTDSKTPFALEDRTLVKNYYDSLGNPLVKEGSGFVKEQISLNDSEEGNYKDGLRDGTWKGTFLKGKYHFEELYQRGKLKRGTSTDSIGKELSYSEKTVQPAFPGGMTELYNYIKKNYQLPSEAKKQKVNGTIVISFVIDTNGKPSDAKIVKDLGYGTGQEAISMIYKHPHWVPGTMRGVPVRVSYSLPINIK